jgi:hypothetical protein
MLLGAAFILLMNTAGRSFAQRRRRHQSVTKSSQVPLTCLPPNVKAIEIAVYGYKGKRNITVAEKIKELKGRCHNGLIVGPDNKEIRFFRVTCWGNPPSDYQIVQAEERRKLEILKAKYAVIVIRCDPGIQ